MAQTTTSAESPPYTNFHTPENAEFYAKFEYKSLHKDYEEIRLLEINPSNSEHRDHYRMSQPVPLGVAGTYCVISYYSGKPTETESVWIDGVKMNIFANLADGMAAAICCWKNTSQDPKQPLRLGVDQICINQSDIVEKSHQVNFMREIYRRATYVYVSMPTPSNVQPALDWLSDLYNWENPRGYEAESGMLYKNMPQVDKPEKSHSYPARFWGHLYQIIGHPWWGRSWVYQEFIVAAEVFILFSEDHWIPWKRLHRLLSFFLQ
ncbi:heterokaryon incompatibility protein [Colletotrichum gloeosporioides Cg-14]|uniref:Heterokaryon incompatibility protein n=1 Tax=Colletotrichum gloeosporioides (strain Cg-14) TaxID=1237896 RepID=T0M3M7_COLGC|nr:heterokaryon incompatibility protein [Colletotrichum gloeosporioides Cg-14]